MRFDIRVRTRRGLRFIEHIPNISLCRVQGYNGIGKTNAIKLLSLCVGDQPFDGEGAAWGTFKDQLLEAHITATELNGANQITWELNPTRYAWPATPAPLGDRIGLIRVDGVKQHVEEVRALLSVHHIVTAETPDKVLEAQLKKARATIKGWVDTVAYRRSSSIDTKLKKLEDGLARCEPSLLKLDLVSLAESRRALAQLEKESVQHKQRLLLLQKAVQLADQLDQVRGEGAEIEVQIAELNRQIEELKNKKDALDAQIATASERRHLDAAAEREFNLAQKHLQRQEKAVNSARAAIERLAVQAGIAPDEERVKGAIAGYTNRLADLVKNLPRAHTASRLLDLIENITGLLDEIVVEELGDDLLLDGSGGSTPLTIAEFKNHLEGRATQLREQVPTTDENQLSQKIQGHRDAIAALTEVLHAFEELKVAEESRTKATTRLRDAMESLPEHTVRTLDELIEARGVIEKQQEKVQAEHARLSYTRELMGGGKTEESLSAELETYCQQAKVAASRVRGQLKAAEENVHESNLKEAKAQKSIEHADEALQRRARELRDFLELVRTSEELAWAREMPMIANIINSASPLDQVENVEKLANVLGNIRDRVTRTVGDSDAIASALLNIASEITQPVQRLPVPNSTSSGAQVWDGPTRRWLASIVRDWFNDDAIKRALFDGASDVQLDPATMSVSWTVAGKPQTRQLRGFSSGEQVFAYTRARISQLDHDGADTPNRLIVLDEFNAFLDVRRMSELSNLLKHRRSEFPSDQVLVVGPLESMPDRASEVVPGGRDRLQQLEQSGYFAEEF